MKYKSDLHSKLEKLPVPESLNCIDTMCDKQHHSKERDDMVLDILCAVVESSHTTVPLAGGRRAGSTAKSSSQSRSGKVAGWRAEVEPFQQKAQL